MAKFFNFFNRKNKEERKKPVIPDAMNYGKNLVDADLFKTQRIFNILPYQGQAFDNPLVRSSVVTNALFRGKLKPIHKRNGKMFPDKHITRLFRRPNRYMNWFDLVQKLSINYDLSGEAFLWIDFDETNGKPIGMYPLSPINVSAIKYEGDDELYLQFTFLSGKILIALYRDVVILRKSFFDRQNSYIFGDSVQTPLSDVLNWDYTLNEATSRYLQNIGVTTGAIEVTQVINPDDLKKLQEQFKNNLNESDVDYRLVVLRPGMKYNQIQTKDATYQKDFAGENKEKIYSLFNINEKIINGTFNSEEISAYNQTTIRTFAIPLEYELTEKLFQKKDRDRGDEIELRIDLLDLLDMKSRVNVLKQMFDTGAITPNEIREKIGFEKLSLEDVTTDNIVDKTYTSLNYTTTDKLTDYQMSKTDTTSNSDNVTEVTTTTEEKDETA